MINYLAEKVIKLYTRTDAYVIFYTINTTLNRELFENFPLLFTYYNLIDLAITNYNDEKQSLNVNKRIISENEIERKI